jgi:hypothetical protein
MTFGTVRGSRGGRPTALLAAALTLLLAATALAAQPKAGKRYSGFTSAPKILGFGAPVTFKVSATASTLTGFSYGSLGCFGAGGFQPGHNPYKSASSTQRVGTIAVAKNGSFSVKNRKSKFTFAGKFGGTILTTSQVTGRFAKAKTATGAITFRQTDIPKHGKRFSCGPGTVTFTAGAK